MSYRTKITRFNKLIVYIRDETHNCQAGTAYRCTFHHCVKRNQRTQFVWLRLEGQNSMKIIFNFCAVICVLFCCYAIFRIYHNPDRWCWHPTTTIMVDGKFNNSRHNLSCENISTHFITRVHMLKRKYWEKHGLQLNAMSEKKNLPLEKERERE